MPIISKEGSTTPTYIIYRVSYQAYFWRYSVEELDIPDAEKSCWETDSKGDFQPIWTTSQPSVTVKNFIATC